MFSRSIESSSIPPRKSCNLSQCRFVLSNVDIVGFLILPMLRPKPLVGSSSNHPVRPQIQDLLRTKSSALPLLRKECTYMLTL